MIFEDNHILLSVKNNANNAVMSVKIGIFYPIEKVTDHI